MKFTSPEVQAVYLTLVELHDQTLRGENIDSTFMQGKRLAYATALQIIMNNCTHKVKI